jgi:hypothetical protein
MNGEEIVGKIRNLIDQAELYRDMSHLSTARRLMNTELLEYIGKLEDKVHELELRVSTGI